MIKIALAVPRDILLKIGAAPEIGRPRWIEFVEAWESSRNSKAVAEDIFSQPSTTELSSRDRFTAVLKALSAKQHNADATNRPQTAELRSKGMTLATVRYAKSGVRLNFMKTVPAEFVDFLLARIEILHEDYLSQSPLEEKNEQ